jgi:hypothetical protein
VHLLLLARGVSQLRVLGQWLQGVVPGQAQWLLLLQGATRAQTSQRLMLHAWRHKGRKPSGL